MVIAASQGTIAGWWLSMLSLVVVVVCAIKLLRSRV